MADNGPPVSPSDNAAAPSGAAPRNGAVPGARTALVLLLLINMFNYIDRQVLAAVEPKVENTFLGELKRYEVVWMGVTWNVEFWMGLLSTAFMVAYMLLAPV